VVFTAIEALAQLATPEAISALLELTANSTRHEACIIALANLGEAQVEAIGTGLHHFYLEVRCATVEVLTRLRCPRASELLITALDDREQIVRLAAVNGLEHLGNRYAERKIAVMAHTDPDPTVRQAAQKALG
ncbi:MAG: HEAT repeat domain-containing protein, partial [Phormidium sp.]